MFRSGGRLSTHQLLALVIASSVLAVLAGPRAIISGVAAARGEIWGLGGQPAATSNRAAGQQPQAPQAVTASFTNSTTINIPSAPSAFPAISSPYPSTINVSGLGTAISAVTLKINGFHHTQQKDIDALLIGPTGASFIFMSDVGGANATPPTIDLTFDDAGATQAPVTVINATATYKPTNSGAGDTFLAPAPGGPYNEAAPAASATFASVYNGTNPNGDWKLYIMDDAGGDIGAFDGGWTLNITTSASAVGTTTTVNSSLNPSLTTDSVSFTAHVQKTSDSTNVTVGTVTFVDNSTGATLASNVALNGSGLATTPAIAGLIERRHLITATYNGDPAFLTSAGNMFQTVDFPTTNPGAGVYANTNGITTPDPVFISGPGEAVQYPSHITVSGLSGIISNVSVSLKNVTHTSTADMDILLVGPGGQNLILLSDSGLVSSNITVNFDDGAASQLAQSGSWGASGSTLSSKPVNYVAGDTWPLPAPAGGYNSPSPVGAATLNSIFGASGPNGVWSLYVYDDAGGDSGTIAGGWSLTFTTVTSVTWNGGTSSNWNTAANWSPAATPSSLLDAVIPTGPLTNEPTISAADVSVTNLTVGAGHTLTVNSGRTLTVGGTALVNGNFGGSGGIFSFNNLTIGNAGGVTLGGNASVSGVLALTSGDLNMGANTLTQPNTSTSSGGFDVIGAVKRTGFTAAPNTLSFGNPNNQLTFTAGTLPTDITISMAKSAPSGFSTAVQRTYAITPNPSNLSGFTAKLRLHYLDGELNGNTPAANLSLRRFNGTGWAPYGPTTPVDTSNNWVENNVVHNFSNWTFSTQSPTASNGIVSGRITDSNGKPVEGAVVRLTGEQSRKFITDANGFYHFDNVETSGFYTVTPSRANYSFSPFNRSFTQAGNQTEAVFTGNSLGDHANPLDTAEYFVRQQYVDILGREPEEAGFNFWSDQINECQSSVVSSQSECISTRRLAVAAAFFMSAEYQASGSYIYDLYAGALGRQPGYSEYSADRQQVIGGATLDAAKSTFAQNFVQRAEFVTKYATAMSADAFVDALLQSVQPTGADLSSERANLIGLYNQTSDLVTSRAAIVKALADNAVFKQSQYNRSFVLTEYFAYLRRDIDQGGYDFWLNVLDNAEPGNYRGMVCSFVTSAEYQNRFSTVVSHSNGECGQ